MRTAHAVGLAATTWLIAALACVQEAPGTADKPLPGEGEGEGEGEDAEHELFTDTHVAELRIDLPADAWAAILADPSAEEWHTGSLTYDGTTLADVSVRVKGNSSLQSVIMTGSHRYSFKVDTNDIVDGQELAGETKLILNNGFKDPTLLRETLAYDLARAAGLVASRTGFVDLTVADEHLGLYTLVEDVGGDFLDEHFVDGDGILYKPEPPAGALRYAGDDATQYVGLEVERNEELGHADFIALVAALDAADPTGFDAVLDVDAALGYLAVSGLLANLDSYLGTAHNYYLYGAGGVFTVIPWDMNEAFGTFTCGCDRAGIIDLKIDEPTCAPSTERPLVTSLLAAPDLLARYHQIVEELLDGPFAEAAMQARIDALAALVRPVVEADTEKFFTTAEFEQGLDSDVVRGGIGLMSFVRERQEAVRAQLAGERAAHANGEGSCRSGGPGPNPCGDGVCDAAEQANPALCPQDCP